MDSNILEQVNARITDHYVHGRQAAYHTACFIHDTVTQYLVDLDNNVHDPAGR